MAREFFAEDRAALRAWLEAHHDEPEGAWVVFWKGERRTMSYDDIAQEALCFGWVDSKPGKVDDERTKLYLAPRKSGSNWSALNKRRVADLESAGLMTPAGRAAVEAARRDGSWDALNDVENLVIPDDLMRALERYPDARGNFEAFPPSTRRGILEWIHNAKRDATRAKRVEETARLAQDDVRANQWPR